MSLHVGDCFSDGDVLQTAAQYRSEASNEITGKMTSPEEFKEEQEDETREHRIAPHAKF